MNVTKMDLRKAAPEPQPEPQDDILADLNTIASMIPQEELQDMVVRGMDEIIRLRKELSMAQQEIQRKEHQ